MLDVNEYFNGSIKSIAFKTDTLPATVGVMTPGEYEFTPSQHETMTVVSGALTVKLPDAEEWVTFRNNDSFEIDANKSFELKVSADTAYLCTYG